LGSEYRLTWYYISASARHCSHSGGKILYASKQDFRKFESVQCVHVFVLESDGSQRHVSGFPPTLQESSVFIDFGVAQYHTTLSAAHFQSNMDAELAVWRRAIPSAPKLPHVLR
jgi:6-phosphogluconate dehydrogenase (decarboxylating)